MSRPKLIPKECSKGGCAATARKRSFCSKHYSEWYRAEFPDRVIASAQLGRVKKREYHRQYYLANKERLSQAAADRYQRYKEESPAKLREWQRRSWAKNKYGITLEEYDEIMSRGCAICGTGERICLDHDHATGKVRDALCHYCNMALGSMKDDPTRLRVAADYLDNHNHEGGDANERRFNAQDRF